MISKTIVPLLTATLLLAGCSVALDALGPFNVPQGKADLLVQADLVSGGLRTQAAVTPYTPANVELVVLSLYKLDKQGGENAVMNSQGAPMTVQMPKATLDSTVTFTHLHANTTYRIKARAYLDANGTQLISKQDASSSTDVAIVQEDRPTLAKIKVQLIDKAFDGQGSTSLDIATGSLIPAGSESITVTAPN